MPAIIFRNLQPGQQPGPGELWIRPNRTEERDQRATALLVLEQGLDALERGTEAFNKSKMRWKTRKFLASSKDERVPDDSPFTATITTTLETGSKDGIVTFQKLCSAVDNIIPQPHYGYFSDDEPDSEFLFIEKK